MIFEVADLDPPRTMFQLRACLPTFETLLDIGPGIRPCDFVTCKSHTAVEPHGTYAEIIERDFRHVDVRRGRWQDERAFFADRQFEAVVALDVIEHMEREDGLLLRDDVARMATRLAVIFTPFGMMEQSGFKDEHDCDHDPWGLDGMVWQKHRSGWDPEDFDGWHLIIGGKPKVMFAIKDYGVGVLGRLGLA